METVAAYSSNVIEHCLSKDHDMTSTPQSLGEQS